MSYGLLNIIFEKYIFDDQNEILNAKNDKIWIFKKLQFSPLMITQIYFVIWYDDALGLRALFILAQTSHRSSAHPPKIWFRVATTTWLEFAQYFVRPPSFAMPIWSYKVRYYICVIINGENCNFLKIHILSFFAFKISFWSSKIYFSKMMFRSP